MSDKDLTRTVFTQDLINISLDSNESLDILLELIKDKVSEGEHLRTHIFSTMCELIWLNSYILLLLKKDMQDLTFKDKDQKEVIMPKTTLDALLSLIVARHAATDELNSFSCSLSLH
tara:strand:+ start:245 stop:595 length:351 start_codon:yes stop_codon:yes gene_type:complete